MNDLLCECARVCVYVYVDASSQSSYQEKGVV